jgi:chromosome segregation protein
MRIKRLEISGFKSFCEHTRILFDHAMTAVVGPNGCGKSNIVDAIRWGLGEQSAKNLRGRGMEDVIFNGSETRGPQSMAEVTITFDNNDGLSHPAYAEYAEIAVTRRLYRDDTSEYLLNKTPCRLKDITDLFLGTGGGVRAYSIIEQGRIGLIVSSRTEDRRSMIEEAAGITRFKKARTIAARKMDQTRQNLLRVSDVVVEMERNLANLKRQARKAERYREYATEQRDLELHLASSNYLELRALAMVATSSLGAAEHAARESREALVAWEAKVERFRVEESAARAALDEAKARVFEVNQAIQVVEGEIRHLVETMGRIRREESGMSDQESEVRRKIASLEDERSVLADRLGALTADAQITASRRDDIERQAASARSRLAQAGEVFDAARDNLSRARARAAASQSALESLSHRVEEVQGRLASMREERGQFDARITGLEGQVVDLDSRTSLVASSLDVSRQTVTAETAAYEELRRRLDVCDAERRAARDEVHAKRSRLDSLEEMHTGLKRHDSAVREAVAALKNGDHAPFAGLLVDFVDCPAEYEVALAAALGERIEALVTADTASGLELLEWLKARDLGRVTALATRDLDTQPALRCELEDPAITARLADVLTVAPEVAALIGRMLESAYVVRTSADALRLWQKSGGRATLVTLDGQVIDDRGAMRGGRPSSVGADLLGQKREIRDLDREVAALKAKHEALDAEFDSTKAALLGHRDAAEKAQAEVKQQEIQFAEMRKDQVRAAEDVEAARQRRDAIEREVALQEEQLSQTREDRDQVAAQLSEAKAEIAALEQAISEHARQIETHRAEADRLAAAVTDARVRQVQFEQQHRSAVERSSQIAAQEEELDDSLRRMARRRTACAEELGRAAGKAMRDKEALSAKLDEAARLGAAVDELTRALDAATTSTQGAESELREGRRGAEALSARVSELRMDEKQSEMQVAYLLDSVAERFDVDLLRVLGDYHMRPLPGDEVRSRIEELRGLIERMGPINPGAIEECAETAKRYDEKIAQKQDVEQALADLEAAISRMDRDSRRMFKETFESVNAKFQEIFPRLFKGGQARLLLTDPDDLLASGVDIVAQPPGKKLGNIELLSGGEKALTAVSLVFAIFLHRPSPFCLLDEVDAPLDEANVGRFVEMVRELTERTQFIVITHSKVTMEGSDALYGVTMQEPGVSKLVSVRLVHAVPAAASA